MTDEVSCFVHTHAQVGEGIIWDAARGRLYWVDIPGGMVHETDPDSAETRSWNIGQPAAFAAVRAGGDLVLAARDGFFFFDRATGEMTAIVDPEAHLPENRFNDACVDPRGRLWAGTMRENGHYEPPRGCLYRLDADGTCTMMVDGLTVSNGLAFSPDGRTMYLSDSGRLVMKIWAFDYDLETGTPSNRRVFADLSARGWAPDGATVDSEGRYWSAIVNSGKLVCFRPDGSVEREIDMPVEKPSKPVIVDGVMYVTSIGVGLTPGTEADQPWAGAVLRLAVDADAPPHPRFAG